MPGTLKGGKKAAQTNKERYGQDFYHRLGARGGKATAEDGAVKGFAANREKAVEAGRKAGKISKRGHRYVGTKRGYHIYTRMDTNETVKFKA